MRLAISTTPSSLMPGRGRRRRDHFWKPENFSCTPSPSLKKSLVNFDANWILTLGALKELKTGKKKRIFEENIFRIQMSIFFLLLAVVGAVWRNGLSTGVITSKTTVRARQTASNITSCKKSLQSKNQPAGIGNIATPSNFKWLA